MDKRCQRNLFGAEERESQCRHPVPRKGQVEISSATFLCGPSLPATGMSLGRKHRAEVGRKVHRTSGSIFYCISRNAFSDLLHDKSLSGNVEPAQFGNDVMDDAFSSKRQRALFDDLRGSVLCIV